MKKLLFILISLSIIFNLCACDITELLAPEDSDTTAQVTSEKTTFSANANSTKKLYKIIVDDSISQKDTFISSNGITITPLNGEIFQNIYDIENDIQFNSDGIGVDDYLKRLENGTMDDSELPSIQISDVLEITFGKYSEIRKSHYINPSEGWDVHYKTPLDDIINLPKGEYYVILEIGTKYSEKSYEVNEFLFQLVISD